MTEQASAEYRPRIARVQEEMRRAGVHLLAIAPTPNMRYLLGFAPFPDERPCALLLTPEAAALVVPELNADQVEARTGLRALRWSDAEGPRGVLAQALAGLGIGPQPVLAADDTMRADHLILLQELARPRMTIPAGGLMGSLRIRKDPDEVELLARAAAHADRALLAGVEACRPGVTERQVGEAVTSCFLRHGAEAVDFTLVASGPNGAYPHHTTSDRMLRPGDTVILDIGATVDGYRCDVTRVVQLGEPPPEVLDAYEAVLAANAAARAAVRPGVRARDVDRAARAVLERAGYGPYFLHRTGHGIGLETHEPPWITAEDDTVLEPGMVFSIEPGVYLEGRFGVRIEDIVAVTEDGCRCLTGADRALIRRDG